MDEDILEAWLLGGVSHHVHGEAGQELIIIIRPIFLSLALLNIQRVFTRINRVLQVKLQIIALSLGLNSNQPREQCQNRQIEQIKDKKHGRKQYWTGNDEHEQSRGGPKNDPQSQRLF